MKNITTASSAFLIGLTILTLSVTAPHRAGAQTTNLYFKGGAAVWSSSSWSTNGAGTGKSIAFAQGDIAVFNSTGANSIEDAVLLTGTVSPYGLVFNNMARTTISSSFFTTQLLSVNNGGITIATNAGAVTFTNLNYQVQGGQNWINNSKSPLTFSANVILESPVAVSGSGSTTIGGTISGPSAIYMYGPGTLTLSGNNSGYAGRTIISGGAVQASSIGSSPLTLFGGGQFVDTATGTITSGAISLAGNATITLQNPYSGVKGSGNVAVSGTNNAISLGAGWTKAGTYTLLSGTTLTGTVTSTSLILKAPFGTIPVNSAPVTYNGYIYTFAAGPNSVYLMILKQ